jgi:cobalt/nickel transport protein
MQRYGHILSIVSVMVVMMMAGGAQAHFGMVIPSDNMVMPQEARRVELHLSFSHPMEMIGMALARPKAFTVWANGQTQDLGSALEPAAVMGQPAWKTVYAVQRPGIYVFVMEPQPYWEPAEGAFIVHYTKTVVTAFGDDDGWDAEIGLKTEIVPLAKPYGLYAGNLFQGIVKLDGQPVPDAAVEVEYYNQDRRSQAPTDYMVTQTIKADRNGVFSYAAPRAGWWGFAALNTADFKLKADGQAQDVELGAIIWVRFEAWQER